MIVAKNIPRYFKNKINKTIDLYNQAISFIDNFILIQTALKQTKYNTIK